MRLLTKVSDPNARTSLHEQIRASFEQHRSLEDSGRIEYLLADGRKQFNQLKGMLDQATQ
jgi:hypothetical protein